MVMMERQLFGYKGYLWNFYVVVLGKDTLVFSLQPSFCWHRDRSASQLSHVHVGARKLVEADTVSRPKKELVQWLRRQRRGRSAYPPVLNRQFQKRLRHEEVPGSEFELP